MSWPQMITNWTLVEFDFRAILHVDLDSDLNARSWRWFRLMIAGLLNHPDSLLHRHFAPEPETPAPSP